jgi:Do/DeqQ family serine protease
VRNRLAVARRSLHRHDTVRYGADGLTERVYHRGLPGLRARYPRAMSALNRLLATGALVSAGFVGGALLTGRLQSRETAETPAAAAAPEAAAAQTGNSAGVALPDFTQIAARTSPAVVNISAVAVYRQRRFADPFFGSLFGDDDQFATQRGQSAGSGVIIGADGYVLTNNHVLGQGSLQQVTVILSDRRERPAKLIGVDPQTDLALLKISEKNLPTVPWGDSGSLKVAEWVLAVGNPYQLGQTVTLGVVSALNRTYDDVSTVVDYIQTDAAINRGNSGGALISRRGELVGINTWIVSESGGSQGIGFAIPSNIARRVADELIKTGEVKRGTIGDIRLAAVTPELARDLNLSDTKGAVVWSLYRTSSAYRAGLRPGDVIKSVDGKAVDTPAQFQRALLEAEIGSVLSLGIQREGARREIRVQVEQQTQRPRQSAE